MPDLRSGGELLFHGDLFSMEKSFPRGLVCQWNLFPKKKLSAGTCLPVEPVSAGINLPWLLRGWCAGGQMGDEGPSLDAIAAGSRHDGYLHKSFYQKL